MIMTSKSKISAKADISLPDTSEMVSSDEDDSPMQESGIDSTKLKAKQSKITMKSSKAKDDSVMSEGAIRDSTIIYLGRIPSAMEESELRLFLKQFGNVERLKLFRSRKSAKPRGYAFVEFDDSEVASIVAETMSGYLIGKKRLVCHLVPPDKVHPELFRGCNRVFRKIDWAGLHREKVNRPKSADKMKEITKRLLLRERKKREQLKTMGIDFNFPGYEAASIDKETKVEKANTHGVAKDRSEKRISENDAETSKVKKLKVVETANEASKIEINSREENAQPKGSKKGLAAQHDSHLDKFKTDSDKEKSKVSSKAENIRKRRNKSESPRNKLETNNSVLQHHDTKKSKGDALEAQSSSSKEAKLTTTNMKTSKDKNSSKKRGRKSI
jgi:nucleolar protein 15